MQSIRGCTVLQNKPNATVSIRRLPKPAFSRKNQKIEAERHITTIKSFFLPNISAQKPQNGCTINKIAGGMLLSIPI
jgi:hypothetical protein